jgi:hypothetical protein
MTILIHSLLSRYVISEDLKMLKFFTERGADLNVVAEHGDTPLISAAKQNLNVAFRYLLAHGADMDRSFTPAQSTLLHITCAQGNEELMELVLAQHPEYATMRNLHGDTPLMAATRLGRKIQVQRLLAMGVEFCDAMPLAPSPYFVALFIEADVRRRMAATKEQRAKARRERREREQLQLLQQQQQELHDEELKAMDEDIEMDEDNNNKEEVTMVTTTATTEKATTETAMNHDENDTVPDKRLLRNVTETTSTTAPMREENDTTASDDEHEDMVQLEKQQQQKVDQPARTTTISSSTPPSTNSDGVNSLLANSESISATSDDDDDESIDNFRRGRNKEKEALIRSSTSLSPASRLQLQEARRAAQQEGTFAPPPMDEEQLSAEEQEELAKAHVDGSGCYPLAFVRAHRNLNCFAPQRSRLEVFVNDSDFKAAMLMTKAQFEELPNWKKIFLRQFRGLY